MQSKDVKQLIEGAQWRAKKMLASVEPQATALDLIATCCVIIGNTLAASGDVYNDGVRKWINTAIEVTAEADVKK